MSSRVVLVSLGGNAPALASALSRLNLSVSVAHDLNTAMLEAADSQLIVVEAGEKMPAGRGT